MSLPHDSGRVVTLSAMLAADYIDRYLWTRSALTLTDRRRLIAHALLRSAPSPALAQLTLHVFRRTDVCAAWHAPVGHTTDELAVILRDTVIADTHLEQALGSHWQPVVDRVVATVELPVEGIRCESGTDAQR